MRFPEGLELKAYGQQLIAGREAKRWTQQQLSKKLFLPVHFIRALEAGEHGMLPEIPYVMSMYRKAATAVGIDPEPMIQACKDYQERQRQPPEEQTQQLQTETGKVVHVGRLSSIASDKQSRNLSNSEISVDDPSTLQKNRRANKGKGDGAILLLGCVLGLVVVALVLLNSEFGPAIRLRLATIMYPETGTTEETQDQALEVPIVQQPAADIPADDDTSEIQPLSQEEQIEGPAVGTVRFIFESNADDNDNRSSWIRVENARGVLLFEDIPESSTSVDLPIADGIRVRLGRPGLVRWQQPGELPQPIPEEAVPGTFIDLIPIPSASQAVPETPTPEVMTEETISVPEAP